MAVRRAKEKMDRTVDYLKTEEGVVEGESRWVEVGEVEVVGAETGDMAADLDRNRWVGMAVGEMANLA